MEVQTDFESELLAKFVQATPDPLSHMLFQPAAFAGRCSDSAMGPGSVQEARNAKQEALNAEACFFFSVFFRLPTQALFWIVLSA